MTLLILAAGSSSRYGGTKQFDGVGPKGEYLLEYNLYDAVASGFDNIVIVCKAGQEDEVTDYFCERLPEKVTIQSVAQSIDDLPDGCEGLSDRTKPWGTAHAIWSARNYIKGRFITINADDFYGRTSFRTIINSQLPVDHFGMIGFQLKQTLSENGRVSRGVCKIENSELERVEEFTGISAINEVYIDEPTGTTFLGDELVSMNMWMLDDSIFPVIEDHFIKFLSNISKHIRDELYLPSIIQATISQERKRVKVFESEEEWMGLTFKEDRSEVSARLLEYSKQGDYPTLLWK